MRRELEKYELVGRSIFKKYRDQLWNPFIGAIKRYRLIEENDAIAVCISGGKDSMLLALLIQQLQRFSEVPFSVSYLVMDPGYNQENRRKIEENAKLLHIPITVFESNVFQVSNQAEKNPCYLCARMRRGNLYAKAKELGCNKIALGHHLNDVIETTFMSMMYGAQIQGMLPMLRSTNFPGMSLIRPLYCVREEDIIAWRNYNQLTFLQCACRFTERAEAEHPSEPHLSKRQETKEIIRAIRKQNPNIEINLFNSLHNVNVDMMPGYKLHGEKHSYLENLDWNKD